MNTRCCSRTACKQPPVYTLTYVYRDSTAVLGPLAAYVEPHCYDLYEKHAARLVVRAAGTWIQLPPDRRRNADDQALATWFARQGAPALPGPPRRAVPRPGRRRYRTVGQGVEVGRRGLARGRSAPTAQPES